MVHEHVSEQGPDRKTAAPRVSAPAGAAGLAALQRTAGNAAVVTMLQRAGQAQDRHRHGAGCGHGVRGQAGADEAQVQRSAVHDVLAAPGRPLDDARRAEMEARLGADFSDVRIHDDGAARASAAEVGARAYTSGSHIVIGDGGGDEHTLAHELTHVIQQRQGPVAGTDNGAGLKVSDPSDRFEREAEANATRVMAGPAPDADRHAPAGHRPEGPVRPAPTAASEPVTVARLVTAEDFKEQSKVPLAPRGELRALDRLLEEYQALGRRDYQGRADVLVRIAAAAATALQGRPKEKRRAAVEAVRVEAGAEGAIYGRLAAALTLPPELASPELIDVYEEILPRIQGAAGNSELTLLSTMVSEELQRRVGGLLTASKDGRAQGAAADKAAAGAAADAALAGLLARDMDALLAMAVDPGVPGETRAVLTEVTDLRGHVDLGVGMPGTVRDEATGRYTMNHAVNQTEGRTERLGSLAHELTHVAAGESYHNTAILLLCDSGLDKEQMRAIALERAGHARALKGLLTDDMVTGRQRSLIENKLEYMTKNGQMGKYVAGFKAKLNAEDETRTQMLEALAREESEASASLVEYDTVLTQLLVYLHSWRVPVDHPFYREVRRLAQAQREGRLAAPAPAAAPAPNG
ncbi:DUF4157 domain-containing protein [Streptomyces sp. NPDC058611]|uniref:eCIS core domain-containing protein n=1 Tax=unclassified Streptomyces TaxID=2593676 RepID=UPI00365986C5